MSIYGEFKLYIYIHMQIYIYANAGTSTSTSTNRSTSGVTGQVKSNELIRATSAILVTKFRVRVRVRNGGGN